MATRTTSTIAIAVTAGLLLTLGTGSGTVRAETANSVVRTAHGRVVSLGPWNISRARDRSLAGAVGAFGGPTLARHSRKGDPPTLLWTCAGSRSHPDVSLSTCVCIVRWRAERLTAAFVYHDAADWLACGPHHNTLIYFQAGSRGWRTERGVHVGDPTSRVRRAYPCSKLAGPKGSTIVAGDILLLMHADEADWRGFFTLNALPKAGRVAALRVEYAFGKNLEPCRT